MLAALCLVGALAALDVQAQSLGGGQSVEIEADPVIPVVGLPAAALVRFLDSRPSRVSVFVRPVGTRVFSELATVELDAGVFRVQLQGAVPPQGIEAYAEYVLDGVTLTEPESDPEEFPYRIPSFNPSAEPPTPLPARQYRMVTIPLLLDTSVDAGSVGDIGSAEPEDLFGDDFGEGADPSRWRLLRFDPDLDRALDYAEDEEFGPVLPGLGYWLITAAGGLFDVEAGLSTGVVFKGSEPFPTPIFVTLQPGWNQIGNPFLFPVDWETVQQDVAVEDPVAFRGTYEPGQETLRPWEGYFVFNPGEITALIFEAFPRGGDGGGGERAGGGAETLPDRLLRRAGSAGYLVDVRSGDGEVADHVYVGTYGADAPEAERLDLHKPPAIDDGLRVTVREDDEAMASSFRAALGAQAWTIEVAAGDDATSYGRSVALWLDEHGTRPDGATLSVDDLDRGVTLARLGRRVDVPSLPGVAIRRLRLRLDAAGGAPETLAIGLPAPNPTTGRVVLPFALPQAGPARVSVFDVLGRLVRLVQNERLDAGSHEVQWDGCDDAGRRVAAGLYVLRLDAASASATARVTVLR